MGRNDTKLRVLRAFSSGSWGPWLTTAEVVVLCDLSLTNASTLLRRYARQGLLTRQRNPAVAKGYFYFLTDAGQARLAYLTETMGAKNC